MIMPIVAVVTGGVDFSNLFLVSSDPVAGTSYATLGAAQGAGAVTVNYGLFINSVVTFFIGFNFKVITPFDDLARQLNMRTSDVVDGQWLHLRYNRRP